jgi:hypothetical protein
VPPGYPHHEVADALVSGEYTWDEQGRPVFADAGEERGVLVVADRGESAFHVRYHWVFIRTNGLVCERLHPLGLHKSLETTEVI